MMNHVTGEVRELLGGQMLALNADGSTLQPALVPQLD
jgi:hypothetical protein